MEWAARAVCTALPASLEDWPLKKERTQTNPLVSDATGLPIHPVQSNRICCPVGHTLASYRHFRFLPPPPCKAGRDDGTGCSKG